MSNRISAIVTKKGDTGETSLANGSRVAKDCLRIQAIGDVDELNSVIGLAISEDVANIINTELISVQNELFRLGAELATPEQEKPFIAENEVRRIEKQIQSANHELPPLKEFILPGGTRLAARLHLARSVCRRAERNTVALAREEKISPVLIKYLNRLSDLLFVSARLANQSANRPDIYWKK